MILYDLSGRQVSLKSGQLSTFIIYFYVNLIKSNLGLLLLILMSIEQILLFALSMVCLNRVKEFCIL